MLEKNLMLGKIEGRKRMYWRQWTRVLNDITESMHMNLLKLHKMLKDREPCHASVHGVAEWDMTEWLNDNNSEKWKKRLSKTISYEENGALPKVTDHQQRHWTLQDSDFPTSPLYIFLLYISSHMEKNKTQERNIPSLTSQLSVKKNTKQVSNNIPNTDGINRHR